MPTYFPTPYPDEVLYSLIARYHQRSGNPIARDTARELFCGRFSRPSMILPNYLGSLAEQTTAHGLDFQKLLINHTLFPFYTVFSSEKNIRRIYDWAKNNEQGSIQMELGAYGNIQSPEHLKFCPQCYLDELKKDGQPYWHRLHQTPGVLVCEKHLCSLLSSNVNYQVRFDTEYYAAFDFERILPFSVPAPLPPELHQKAMWLTQDIKWLYENYHYVRSVFASCNYSFSDIFIYHLIKLELATKHGSLRRDAFMERFSHYYPSEFLKLLDLDIDNHATPWIVRICRKERLTTNPIKYALMARFVCGSLKEFVNTASSIKDSPCIAQKSYSSVADEDHKRIKYREAWLRAREEHPNASRNELREQNGPTYTWLLRHDNEWLFKNMPPAKKRGGSISYTDWGIRDQELCQQAYHVIQRLLQQEGPPVQISVSRIGQELKCLSLLRKKPHLLPKTTEVIRSYVEDNHQFRIRRIRWAMDELARQNLPIVKWRVMKLANVRDELWDSYWPPNFESILSNKYPPA